MADTWEKTKSELMAYATGPCKVKNVKIPDPKVSYAKFAVDMKRLSQEYGTAIGTLQSKVVAMKQQCGTVKPALEMFSDQAGNNNFNIDPKSKDADVIKYFRIQISKFTDGKVKEIDDMIKCLDALEKTIKSIISADLDV